MEINPAYYPSLLAEKTSVTLVAPGLNLKPEAMLPLVAWLNSQGSDVYLVYLSGHYAGGINIDKVTSSIWQSEMEAGYKLARKAAGELSLPLFFLGYSMGALLGQSMIALPMKKRAFDKQVLLAPATAIRPRSYLLKLLLFIGKKMALPSFSPEEYRVHNALPLLAYDLLFKEEEKVVKSKFYNVNIPTLVIIDPKDELISAKKLRQQISRYALTQYRLIMLKDDPKEKREKHHHLIIDEQTLGEQNWKKVLAEIKSFLFNEPV